MFSGPARGERQAFCQRALSVGERNVQKPSMHVHPAWVTFPLCRGLEQDAFFFKKKKGTVAIRHKGNLYKVLDGC